jgi:hypothetical protein
MFMAPYVFSGPTAAAWHDLPNDASRLLVHLLVDLTADRAHPYWSVRPLSLSHLRRLWPGARPDGVEARKDRARTLRSAVEAELGARLEEALPDVATGAQHQHDKTIREEGNCSVCAQLLAQEGPTPPDLREQVLKAVAENDTVTLLKIVPSVVSEMIAQGWTTSFVHRLANGFLLDPQKKQTGRSFDDRLREGLSPAQTGTSAERWATLRRELVYDKPGSFSFPPGAPDIDGVNLVITPGHLFLQLRQVPDTLSRTLQAADTLDTAAATWAAYFRLAVPGHSVSVAGTFKIDADGNVSGIRRPEHRRLWSVKDAGSSLAKLIATRRLLEESDAARLDAAVAWSGLAVALWEEAPIRSLALLWMAMEALYGNPRDVYRRAPLPYLKRLPLELGHEVARHVNRRRAVANADWVAKVTVPGSQVSVSEFIRCLVEALAQSPSEVLLRHRAEQVSSLFSPMGHGAAAKRVRRELQFLYSIRNAMAHIGRTGPLGPVTLYLMNVGMEVLKATLAELIAAAEKAPAHAQLSIDEVIDSCATQARQENR